MSLQSVTQCHLPCLELGVRVTWSAGAGFGAHAQGRVGVCLTGEVGVCTAGFSVPGAPDCWDQTWLDCLGVLHAEYPLS